MMCVKFGSGCNDSVSSSCSLAVISFVEVEKKAEGESKMHVPTIKNLL